MRIRRNKEADSRAAQHADNHAGLSLPAHIRPAQRAMQSAPTKGAQQCGATGDAIGPYEGRTTVRRNGRCNWPLQRTTTRGCPYERKAGVASNALRIPPWSPHKMWGEITRAVASAKSRFRPGNARASAPPCPPHKWRGARRVVLTRLGKEEFPPLVPPQDVGGDNHEKGVNRWRRRKRRRQPNP